MVLALIVTALPVGKSSIKWITYLMYSRSTGSAIVLDGKRCPKFTTPSKIIPVRLCTVILESRETQGSLCTMFHAPKGTY